MTGTNYYPTLIPAVSKIDWLSNIAFPNIDEASRQITSFGNSGAPGRLAWQASTSAPDGRTTVQWYNIDNNQKVPIDNPSTDPAKAKILEVSLPQLTEMLELGGYVPDGDAPTGIDRSYYNTVLWFQSPFDSWTAVYAYYKDDGSLVGGVTARSIGEQVYFENGVQRTWVDTSNIEIDYERRVLRLTFPGNQESWGGFQANTLLNSNTPLAVGPMQAGSGVSKNLVATNDEKNFYQPLDTFNPNDFAYFGTGYTTSQKETLAEYRRPLANQIGVVYQSRSFEPAIKQGFRAANPDLSLYSTLGGVNWYLLADPQSMVTRSVGWSNWKSGEPNNLNGTENNVVMTGDGTWYDLAADQQRPYVLVKPDGSYQLVEGNYTFSQAIEDAGNRGGYVAGVTDYDSQERLKTAADGNDVWINVRRAQYGVGWEAFNLATRTYDHYSNWHSGEPNDSGGIEDNAVMASDGRWYDLAASQQRPYVLAKPDGSYQFISGNFTFSAAEADAGQRGGFVAGVADEFSQRSVQSAAGGREVWINLNDTAIEGSWVGQAPTRNYISDSSATTQDGVFSQQNSSLINTTALNQVNINTSGYLYEQRQMQNIAARQNDGLGLFFTRFEKNEGGDFQPLTQRVSSEYDRGRLTPGMQMDASGATLNLQTTQLNLGTRVIIPPTENSRGSWLVNLEGMTISSPADVISRGGVGPYTIGQIPVWLVNKIGYTNAAGSQPPAESWTIPVTLKYPPSIDFPDGLTLNATAKTIHTVPTQPSPIPTTQLEIEFSATDAVTYRTRLPANPNMVTGSVGWSNWKPGEPNNFNGIEDNVVMRSDGTWNDMAADQQRPYVLAKPDGSYQYISGNFTFSQAIEDAANRGGYVAGVTDYDSYDSQVRLKTEAGGNEVWINVRRASGGVGWQAFNNATRSYDHYSNWQSEEPNDFGGIEDNAVMTSDGRWNDLAVDQQRPYVLVKPDGSYQFISGNFTFSQAEADAGQRGGFVAGVVDEFSQRRVQSAAGGREVWINLNDTAIEGSWVTQAAITSGTQTRSSQEIASSLWTQLGSQRPDITLSDSTFSDAAVNSQQPLDTSQWVLWKPSFSNMQEAFSVLMSAYLKLYQNQLQLAGSVVDWYNGQIKALNDCLEIVNSWGLSTNTKDSTPYTYVSTFADRTPGGGVTNYGQSIAAQYDSIAQTLALYNIKLSDYVSVAWPNVDKTDQTSDPRKNNPDASKEPFNFTVYTDDQVPGVYTYKRYIWGGAKTGSSMFDNFTTAIKNAISNLTNVSQQQTSAYSNLNSQYTQGVSTLTQVLEKLNQASSGVVAKL